LIEWRYANGNYDRVAQLAVDLVQSKVDVIVVDGIVATRALQLTTSTIPIVMAIVANPLGSGHLCSPGCMDNDTATVHATKSYTTIGFINHGWDLTVELQIREGVEILQGKVPVKVRGDGGSVVSYADQYDAYKAYATVRPNTVSAAPEPGTSLALRTYRSARQKSVRAIP
jgi:ABC transporter substrate binding protein